MKLIAAMLLLGSFSLGCVAADAESESIGSTTQALSTQAVTNVANVYNVGVANGYILSFTSVSDFTNSLVSFNQQSSFWPRNGGDGGASITYNGSIFDLFPVSNPGSFAAAQSNTTTISNNLAGRTHYAAFFSLGSLITSAEMQANFLLANRSNYPVARINEAAAKGNLFDALTLVQKLCKTSTADRSGYPATTFDMTGLWDAYNYYQPIDLAASSASQTNGLISLVHNLRLAWGTVISTQSKLESGSPGPSCG